MTEAVRRWVDVGATAELEFNPGAAVRIDDLWIAVFRDGAGYAALDNVCPHASAPLCDGSVVDGKVVCFLHCWEFDLRTGACDMGEEWNVGSYPVREVGDRLQVGVPAS